MSPRPSVPRVIPVKDPTLASPSAVVISAAKRSAPSAPAHVGTRSSNRKASPVRTLPGLYPASGGGADGPAALHPALLGEDVVFAIAAVAAEGPDGHEPARGFEAAELAEADAEQSGSLTGAEDGGVV